jgi:hypothetical protein
LPLRLLAACGQEGGAMFTMQQKVHRSLECVWTLSEKGLACTWVEISAKAPAGNRQHEGNTVMERKVA